VTDQQAWRALHRFPPRFIVSVFQKAFFCFEAAPI
jgi:hypothetical protein